MCHRIDIWHRTNGQFLIELAAGRGSGLHLGSLFDTSFTKTEIAALANQDKFGAGWGSATGATRHHWSDLKKTGQDRPGLSQRQGAWIDLPGP